MLSHIPITVMCMQLLHALHMHALAQAHPAMPCISLVIMKFLIVDYNVYYAEELQMFFLMCTHTHLTHMHAPMHTRMHHARHVCMHECMHTHTLLTNPYTYRSTPANLHPTWNWQHHQHLSHSDMGVSWRICGLLQYPVQAE